MSQRILPADDDEPLGVSAMWTTPQIYTGDDGRHFDAAGREHEAVVVIGEVTYVLASPEVEPEPVEPVEVEPLTSWPRPRWAERSRLEDDGIAHVVSRPVEHLGPDGRILVGSVEVEQRDALEQGPDRSSVVRHPAEVALGDLILTLDQGEALGRTLLGLVEHVRTSWPTS
jgi:hypothetical protein